MSGTLATPRALLSLLVAASLVVAGAAQADDVGIKPQDIKREALSSTVVEMAYSTSQQALFVSAPDWKEEARSACCGWIPTPWRSRQRSRCR